MAQTIPKLIICANRCGQSTPKVRATSSICPPWATANTAKASMALPNQEQRVEHDRFGEGDSQDGLDHDLRGRAGVPPDRDRRTLTNQSDADGRTQSCQA